MMAYGQKDRNRSTKHTHKIKDRVTRTPLKIKLALIDNADSGRIDTQRLTNDHSKQTISHYALM
jgi:hypothetical protein